MKKLMIALCIIVLFTYSNHFAMDNFTYNKPIPEPGTMLILGFALLGLAGIARKKLLKK